MIQTTQIVVPLQHNVFFFFRFPMNFRSSISHIVDYKHDLWVLQRCNMFFSYVMYITNTNNKHILLCVPEEKNERNEKWSKSIFTFKSFHFPHIYTDSSEKKIVFRKCIWEIISTEENMLIFSQVSLLPILQRILHT